MVAVAWISAPLKVQQAYPAQVQPLHINAKPITRWKTIAMLVKVKGTGR